MQLIIFHVVDVSGPLLRGDSCGSVLISEHLSYSTTISLRIFGDHLIYGRFICINSAILIINIR